MRLLLCLLGVILLSKQGESGGVYMKADAGAGVYMKGDDGAGVNMKGDAGAGVNMKADAGAGVNMKGDDGAGVNMKADDGAKDVVHDSLMPEDRSHYPPPAPEGAVKPSAVDTKDGAIDLKPESSQESVGDEDYPDYQQVFRGVYRDGCKDDGMYYKDQYSFVMCSNRKPYVQQCAQGTMNSGADSYEQGDQYYFHELCDVNLIAENAISDDAAKPMVKIPTPNIQDKYFRRPDMRVMMAAERPTEQRSPGEKAMPDFRQPPPIPYYFRNFYFDSRNSFPSLNYPHYFNGFFRFHQRPPYMF